MKQDIRIEFDGPTLFGLVKAAALQGILANPNNHGIDPEVAARQAHQYAWVVTNPNPKQSTSKPG
jgi:hypothetical protein